MSFDTLGSIDAWVKNTDDIPNLYREAVEFCKLTSAGIWLCWPDPDWTRVDFDPGKPIKREMITEHSDPAGLVDAYWRREIERIKKVESK